MTKRPSLSNRSRRGQNGVRGQIILLLALAMLVLLGMIAVGLDGSFALLQERRDQNAADFATLAGAQKLQLGCGGGALTTNADVYQTIQSVLNQNTSNVTGFTAKYLDGNGVVKTPIPGPGPPADPGYAGPAPFWACGVQVKVDSQWHTFLASIIGQPQVSTAAVAAAGSTPSIGQVASIYSLNKVFPHSILAGGSGRFFITKGDMYLNSTDNQIYTGSGTGPLGQLLAGTDIGDVKASSNIQIWGTVHSPHVTGGNIPAGYTSYPLDNCFTAGFTNLLSATPPVFPATPLNTPPCKEGFNGYVDNTYTTTFNYNHIDNNWTPQGDLLGGPGGILDPLDAANLNSGACSGNPGTPDPTFASAAAVLDLAHLRPGTYNFPMVITNSTTFADCNPALQLDTTCPHDSAITCSFAPGIYRFPKGLAIEPSAGQTVSGDNIMIATGLPTYNPAAPILDRGLPANVGNGAPCVPAGALGLPQGAFDANDLLQDSNTNGGAPANGCGALPGFVPSCPAIPRFPTVCPANSVGTGSNFSLTVGGQVGATVDLEPPQHQSLDGTNWADIMFFQHRSDEGNYGFDARPGDGANVNVWGLVYNPSLPNAGVGLPGWFQTWDNGIPFLRGGVLQTGYAAWDAGHGWGASVSQGTVTLNGIAVVDNFNTDGNTDINITGAPYNFPNGGLNSGLIG